MPDIRSEICRRVIKLSKFKASLLHEGTSEIGNGYFVGCYPPWPKDDIYSVTNISVEILMYIQIFVLVKAVFSVLFKGNSTIQFKNHKKTNETNDGTNENSGNFCK